MKGPFGGGEPIVLWVVFRGTQLYISFPPRLLQCLSANDSTRTGTFVLVFGNFVAPVCPLFPPLVSSLVGHSLRLLTTNDADTTVHSFLRLT
jgi:hypothetical protein